MIQKAGLDRLSSTMAAMALGLALVLLVAVASVDAPFRSLLRGEHSDLARILVDLLPILLLGTGLAVIAALVVHTRSGPRARARPFRTTLGRVLPPAAAGVVVVCLLLLAHFDFGARPDAAGARILVETESRPFILWSMSDWFEGLAIASEDTRNPGGPMEIGALGGGRLSYFQLALGILAALVGGGVLWLWHRRRLRRDPAEAEEADGDDEVTRERARGALADMIRAMLADPDANTAIRGAYARLLQGLDERGRGRLEYEGPMEHLHRVLTTLRVRPAPLRELIELFELARFSPHVLSGAHRDRALMALRAVAADLESGPGGGP